MADQADPAPAVASVSDEVADNAPTTEEANPVETDMTEAEEPKEADTVTPDKEVEECAYSRIYLTTRALDCSSH